MHHVGLEVAIADEGGSEAGAIDRHGIARTELRRELGADSQAGSFIGALNRLHATQLPDDAGEHQPLTTPGVLRGRAGPRPPSRTRSPVAGSRRRSGSPPVPPA